MGIVHTVDLIIGVCFIFSVLIGYHRGFVVTIARLMAMVVSYLGAVAVARVCQTEIAVNIILPVLEKQLDIKLFGEIGGEALTAAAEGLSYTLIFAVIFSVLQLVFLIVVSALKLVDHIPVLGKLNKLGGAVLGFFWMFLLCLLLGNVFFTYVPKELRHQWGFTKKAVQNTVLLSVFTDY